MDAKNVRKVSQIILNRFTELHKENHVKFSKECLPMLISGVSKDMYENYSYKFLSNEDTVNLLVNKTFELCKFVDNVRIQDVRSLYNMIYKVGLLRYENYDVNEKLNPANKWNECSENLINHYWETSEIDKKEFFKYLENVDYYTPEDARYPEYYIENGRSLVKVSKELILHLEGLNQTIVYGVKKSKYGHIFEEHLNCDKSNFSNDCPVCDTGLKHCLACGEWEGDLTMHCRGYRLSEDAKDNLCKRLKAKKEQKLDYFLGKDIVIPERIMVYKTDNALEYFTGIIDQLVERDNGNYRPENYLYLNEYFEEQFQRIIGEPEEVRGIAAKVRNYLYHKLFNSCLYIPYLDYNNLASLRGNHYEKLDKVIQDLTKVLTYRKSDYTIKDLDDLCKFYENVFKTAGMTDTIKIREKILPISYQFNNFNLTLLGRDFKLRDLLAKPVTIIKTKKADKVYNDLLEILPQRSVVKSSVSTELTEEQKVLPQIYYIIPLIGKRKLSTFEMNSEELVATLRITDKVIYTLGGNLEVDIEAKNVKVIDLDNQDNN